MFQLLKQTKIMFHNNGRVELSQSKKVTASKTTSKNLFKSSRKYLLTALCVCFIAFYSYHMTADMIYNVCYFYHALFIMIVIHTCLCVLCIRYINTMTLIRIFMWLILNHQNYSSHISEYVMEPLYQTLQACS